MSIHNSYFHFDKYGPRGYHKDHYIDHHYKSLPHVEFTDECLSILELTITRYRYIPRDVIEATLFDRGYTELFEKEENNG